MKRRAPLKRTPLRRSSELAKGPSPKRRTRLKARNAKRDGHRFPKGVDLPYRAWIRSLPCLIAVRIPTHVCDGVVECCHVKSRGAGGGDRGNCYPACTMMHDIQHVWGIRTFQENLGVNLREVAIEYDARYVAARAPAPPTDRDAER